MEKSGPVSLGELQVGMKVTVLRWKDETAMPVMSPGGGPPVMLRFTCSQLCGVPLEVMAINLPYVVVDIIGTGKRANIDSRRLDFMEITDNYIDALLGDEE